MSSLANPHSITVDPLTGNVFVPLAGNTAAVGGNTACALGCIAVYGANVPEPASLPIILSGIGMVLAFGARRCSSQG